MRMMALILASALAACTAGEHVSLADHQALAAAYADSLSQARERLESYRELGRTLQARLIEASAGNTEVETVTVPNEQFIALAAAYSDSLTDARRQVETHRELSHILQGRLIEALEGRTAVETVTAPERYLIKGSLVELPGDSAYLSCLLVDRQTTEVVQAAKSVFRMGQ